MSSEREVVVLVHHDRDLTIPHPDSGPLDHPSRLLLCMEAREGMIDEHLLGSFISARVFESVLAGTTEPAR